METDQLQQIFETEFFDSVLRKRFSIKAVYHPYRTLRCNIERTRRKFIFRVSEHYRPAEPHVIQALAKVLIARGFGQSVNANDRKVIQQYAEKAHDSLPVNKMNYQPAGKYYDLAKIFDANNEIFFDGNLSIGTIGWSKRNSYRRLGYYDRRRNLIVISKIFDSVKVPQEVLEYLVYHEMLHIKIPARPGRIHPPEFKTAERAFPSFKRIQIWLNKNIKNISENY